MSQHNHGIRPGMRDPDAPERADSSSLLWSDTRLLGYGPMDATHEEFYQVAFALLTCEETNLYQALDAFEAHARKHFEQEEEWMRSTDFPPRDCHIQEHAAVLDSVRDVREQIMSGVAGAGLAQSLAMFLLQWFPGHADYLDSALATWMTKRAFGGQPVVFRRSMHSV